MDGLRSELRRLGMAKGQANKAMAKAEELARQAYVEPQVPVIARKVKVTTTPEQERSLQESLAIIATAFRNGLIDEDKARTLVEAL